MPDSVPPPKAPSGWGAATFFYNQFFANFKAPTSPSLEGRTVVITGANVGLGLAAALHLARLEPAVLILACRSSEKGQKAAEEVIAQTGFAGDLEVWDLDLAAFASVVSFAKRLAALARLDILIENAGINTGTFQLSEDKHELTTQVNVLSTGLLGLLSLPVLAKTASLPLAGPPFKPHLTVVSSEMHEWGAFEEARTGGKIFEAFDDRANFSIDRYPTTKLLNLFLVHELAKIAGDEVQVVAVNPGFCKSEIAREFPHFAVRAFTAVMGWTTEKGGRNLAIASVELFPSGSYISTGVVTEPASNATSATALEQQERVWTEATEIWRAQVPAVDSILRSDF